MEYKELEVLWKQYDEKLNNLEKINSKLLKETLLKKPQKKLNRLKFTNLYGVISIPIIILIAQHPNFRTENIDWKFILGCVLTFVVILYLCIEQFRCYLILRKIDLSIDSAIQSLNKVVKLKTIANNFQKSVFFYYPIICLGITLISWNNFVFSTNTIIFLSVLFIVTYCLNIWGTTMHKGRINNFEKDIAELKEYTE